MRLDWIFLPMENPCAKFYIIMIIIIMKEGDVDQDKTHRWLNAAGLKAET